MMQTCSLIANPRRHRERNDEVWTAWNSTIAASEVRVRVSFQTRLVRIVSCLFLFLSAFPHLLVHLFQTLLVSWTKR